MIERLVQIIGLLRLRQRHLPVSPQLTLDASCKFVKETADGVQRETLKVNEDGNVFGIKVMAELVEDRGLPGTHLAIQSNNIALVLANKAFGDKLEDLPGGRLGPLAGDFEDRFGVRLTRVGHVVEGDGVSLLRPGATSPDPFTGLGFNHFTVR